MTFEEYQQEAVKTAIYKKEDNIVYPAIGLANEVGEVMGKIKKVLRDSDGEFNTETNYAIAMECGDALWYMAALLRDLGVNFDTVAQNNIQKLRSRQERGVLQGSGDER